MRVVIDAALVAIVACVKKIAQNHTHTYGPLPQALGRYRCESRFNIKARYEFAARPF